MARRTAQPGTGRLTVPESASLFGVTETGYGKRFTYGKGDEPRNGEDVGWVTSSVMSPKLGCAIALAYLRHGHHDPGTAVAVADHGPAEVTALPFPSSN